MHVSVLFFTKAKIEVIHLTIADISFRQNYGKLGEEFMTNKIGVQWKNNPHSSEISLPFDKVPSTGVENSGKIKRSTNL